MLMTVATEWGGGHIEGWRIKVLGCRKGCPLPLGGVWVGAVTSIENF